MEVRKIPLVVFHTDPLLRRERSDKRPDSILKEYDQVLLDLEAGTVQAQQGSRVLSGTLQKAPPVPIPRQRNPSLLQGSVVEERYIDENGQENTRKRRIAPAELFNSRNVRRRPLWPAGPVDALGSANRDPFNASPLGSDGHVHEMVHLYLNAHLILALQTTAARPVRHRMVDIRKQTLFPTVMSSPAACSALLAYLEGVHTLSVKHKKEIFVRWHLHVAMSLANRELADPAKLAGDGLMLTITLLMNIAYVNNDLETFRVHAQGLVTLAQRRELATGPQSTHFFDNHQKQIQADDGHPCVRGTSNGTGSSPTSAASDHTISSGSTSTLEPTEDKFTVLLDKKLISLSFAHSLQFHLILAQLISRARHDSVLAAGIQQHFCTDGIIPQLAPFEVAVHASIRLCEHHLAWPHLGKPCAIALGVAHGVRAALEKSELDMLYFKCPLSLVWMCLLAGPVVPGHVKAWYANVLRKATAMAHLGSFRKAVTRLRDDFAWYNELDLPAELFWVSALYPESEICRNGGRIASMDREADNLHLDLARKLNLDIEIPKVQHSQGPWTTQTTVDDMREAENSLSKTMALASESYRIGNTAALLPTPPCLMGSLCGGHDINYV